MIKGADKTLDWHREIGCWKLHETGGSLVPNEIVWFQENGRRQLVFTFGAGSNADFFVYSTGIPRKIVVWEQHGGRWSRSTTNRSQPSQLHRPIQICMQHVRSTCYQLARVRVAVYCFKVPADSADRVATGTKGWGAQPLDEHHNWTQFTEFTWNWTNCLWLAALEQQVSTANERAEWRSLLDQRNGRCEADQVQLLSPEAGARLCSGKCARPKLGSRKKEAAGRRRRSVQAAVCLLWNSFQDTQQKKAKG